MNDTDHVLDAIDHALSGDTSLDAMRWSPEEPGDFAEPRPPVRRSPPPQLSPELIAEWELPCTWPELLQAEAELQQLMPGAVQPLWLHWWLGLTRETIVSYVRLPPMSEVPPPMSAHTYYATMPYLLDALRPPYRPVVMCSDGVEDVRFASTTVTLSVHRAGVTFGARAYTWPVLIDPSRRWFAGPASMC